MNNNDDSPRFSLNLVKNPNPLSIILVLLIIIVLTIILPVPSFVINILINLSFLCASAILLATVITFKIPVMAFLKLPVVILFYTMLRLFINFSVTKLFIMKGFDFQSKIVKTAGAFTIISPDILLLIGGIILLVFLTTFQFLIIFKGIGVIVKGKLNYLPNICLAIDFENKIGIIDDSEAERRVGDQVKENHFYLEISNVFNFIKADVIAGLFITIFNIVGGILFSMIFRNESMSFSYSNYLILVIGAGLINIIPSLLIGYAIAIITKKVGVSSPTARNMPHSLLPEL